MHELFTIPGAPAELMERINARRSRIPVGMVMTTGPAEPGPGNEAPERPDGVSEEEWGALGDPGKQALVRERQARVKAESDLAAARKPKPAPPKQPQPGDDDIASIVQRAVADAMQPFHEAQAQRDAEQAAQLVVDSVRIAAEPLLHDPADALAHLDLTTLTDGAGRADATKITAALADLAQRKPHLAKPVDNRRRPNPGDMLGGTTAVGIDDRVKSTLAQMQSAVGIKIATD